jgi:hypothetical protein
MASSSAHDAPQRAHARDWELKLLTAAVWKSRTSSDRGEGTSGERLGQMQQQSPYLLEGGRRA